MTCLARSQTVRYCFWMTLGILSASISSEASAAEMPSKYQGTWSISNCSLPQKESEIGEFPYLLVTRRGYEGHEVSCTLKSISKGNVANSEKLFFSCSSEGEKSAFSEIWSIKKRRTVIWGWDLSETILVRKGGEYGEGRYTKCAISTARRKIN